MFFSKCLEYSNPEAVKIRKLDPIICCQYDHSSTEENQAADKDKGIHDFIPETNVLAHRCTWKNSRIKLTS